MNLADLLFGAYRRDVLALLLLHADESYHVREIARITRRPANTIYRELALLAQVGLLLRRRMGNQVHYRANPDSPIYEELRAILKKTVGIADVLREALAPVAEKIQVAFIYGSIASGEERSRSDVDVMIAGDVTFDEVVQLLAPTKEALRREVNPSIYGTDEFRRKLRSGSTFLKSVLSGKKIYLIGNDDVLGKLANDRKA